jgi:hypothetical protein
VNNRMLSNITKMKTVEEVLSKLERSTRTKSEKWVTIESNLQYIIDARRRGVSFRAISKALVEAGIEVQPATLRVFVTKQSRYLEAFPKASERSNTPSKNRQSTRRVSKERKTEKPLQGADEKQAAEPKTEPSTVTASVVSSPPKPIMNPNDFAGIRRLNARK